MNKENKLTDLEVASKLVTLALSAKNRSKEFNISFNKMKRVLNSKKCYYTGVPIVFKSDSVGNHDHNKLTIDRIDNDKGYVDDNIVACSHAFNQVKGNLTVSQIKSLYKGLQKAKLCK